MWKKEAARKKRKKNVQNVDEKKKSQT